MNAHSSPKSATRPWLRWSVVLAALLLIGLLSGCELPFGSNDAAQQTLSAMIVQSTMIAEGTRMAQEYSATQLALQNAQQAMPTTEAPVSEVQPTETIQPLQVTPTVETAASPSPEGGELVEITAWEAIGWNSMSPEKCDEPEIGCWGVLNFKVKTSLTSELSVYIDPAWLNPYLVFWSKHNSEVREPFGYIMVSPEGSVNWEYLDTVASPQNYWQKRYFDLSQFKGDNILVRFYCEPVVTITQMGNLRYLSYSWFIQDVVVDPNFSGQ